MTRVLVRICDSEDSSYDSFVLAPDEMGQEEAANVVGDAILEVQAEDETEYSFDELIKKLERLGFTFPETIIANAAW